MNRKNRLLFSLGVITICAAVGLSSVGCQTPEPQPGVAETETLPDLTDDRTPTAVDKYAAMKDGAFVDAAPVDPTTLTYEDTEGGVSITGYTGTASVVVLPDAIDGKPVVAIDDGAFTPDEEAEGVDLTALYIPDSVTFIGHGALKGCDQLTALRTPVAVAPGRVQDEEGEIIHSFGAIFGASGYNDNAGAVPKKLTTLIFGKGVETIPDYALYACRRLEVVVCPSTLKSIGNFAFYDCEALAYIDLTDTALTTVGECAFTHCAALLNLELPATVTSVGLGAVKGCAAMESMTLPFIGGTPKENTYLGYLFGATDYTLTEGHMPVSLMSVTLLAAGHDLPANAFFGCSYLREVTIPEGVKSIGHRAFYGCARLSSIVLPDSVTTVGDEAFAGCLRLQTVEPGDGVRTLGIQAFMRCLTLKEITLPATITAIPASCFAGCISLTTVTAPGITSADRVGKNAYRGCTALAVAPYIPAETETAEA